MRLIINNENYQSPATKLTLIGAELDLVPLGESQLNSTEILRLESEAYRLIRKFQHDCDVRRACNRSAFLQDMFRFIQQLSTPSTRQSKVALRPISANHTGSAEL